MRQLAEAGWQFTTAGDLRDVRDRVLAEAEALSIAVTTPGLAHTPPAFRDAHGTSVFAPLPVFTSRTVLEAERRLLELAADRTGPAVSEFRATAVAGEVLPGRTYRLAPEDQAPAAVSITTSGRVVDVLVGPAGTGKTTSMAGVRAIWEAEYGPGTVLGLAPSAQAAHVLAADLGITTDNVAQWLTQQDAQPARQQRLSQLQAATARTRGSSPVPPGLAAAITELQAEIGRWSLLRPGQLLIVDEAGMAGTFALRRLADQAASAGAKLLLVGDPCQLSAVETGGAFGLLAANRPDVPALHQVRRFVDPDGTTRSWEQHTAAGLRVGDDTVIATYAAHGRIRAGTTEQIADAAYTAWAHDTATGAHALLIAGDNDTVRDLNHRAHTDLVATGAVREDMTVSLADGLHAGRGDRIVTRQIDRYLTDGTTGSTGRNGRRTDGFVRNGQQWLIDHVDADGSLTVRLLGGDRQPDAARIVLPADYVAQHVELAYATTAHRAQGMTADTCHVLADTRMPREAFYVAMTRGRHANHTYLNLDPHIRRQRRRRPPTRHGT